MSNAAETNPGSASMDVDPGARTRMHDVDMVRGLCLVGMFVYHCLIAHHRLYQITHPFIFDAAIIFVAVSGFMAGLVYGSRRTQPLRLLESVYRRVGVLALVHLGLLAALMAALAGDDRISGGDPALRSFLGAPSVSLGKWFAAVLLLQHQPVLFDILPVYIVSMAIAPAFMLATAPVRGLLLLASWTLWLASWTRGWTQRDAFTGETIHFALASWQAVFITGCVVALERKRVVRWFGKSLFVATAWIIVITTTMWVCLPYLASAPPDTFWERLCSRFGIAVELPERIGKTTVHPVLVISFAAAALLWWRHRMFVQRIAASVPGRMLALLGSHTLPIFVFGTLLCIITAWLRFRVSIGEGQPTEGFTTGGMLLGQLVIFLCLAMQFALAWFLDYCKRRRRSLATSHAGAAVGGSPTLAANIDSTSRK